MTAEKLNAHSKIWVAGHRGLVGSGLLRALSRKGYDNILVRHHDELDLREQLQVRTFLANEQPEYVIVAAAKVGGILYNQNFQADFLHDNLLIAANLIGESARNGVKKLLYLGSSCIYPKQAEQPIKESALLTGPLEPTNEGYALAKIAGLKLCEKFNTQYKKRFISAMPTNLYGQNDNFHPEHSHVIPGMMRRFHEAKVRGDTKVAIWGSGTPKREFLYVDDLADALIMLLESYEEPSTINVGTGRDCSIKELAELMREVVGFKGDISFDHTKPDGMPKKVLDISRIRKLGWEPKISLQDGLEMSYKWALANRAFG